MKTLVTLFFTLFFAFSYAQNVRGILKDSKKPVFPATVTVKETAETASTSSDGSFSFNLKPGRYHLEIKATNFSKKHLVVNLNAEDVDLGTIQMTNEQEIDEVTLEYYSSGEAKALEMKRNSNAIMDVLSADAMGKLPDVSAAEAVQRVSGVSIERDQGEGRYATVRGTPSQWSSSTINGDRMPSAKTSGDLLGNRTVPLDLLPTQFLDYVQVVKAITPEYEGDAIGGTINFVPKTAAEKETFRVVLASRYNLRAQETFKPNGSVIYGNRYFKKKLGFLALAYYNQRSYATDDYELVYGNEFHNVNTLDVRNYQGVRTNTGFNLATDFRFNKNNKVFVRGYYTQFLDEEENRKTMFQFNKTSKNAILRWSLADYLFKNYGGEMGYEGRLSDQLKVRAKLSTYTSWAGYNGPSSADRNTRGYYYGNWVQTVKFDNLVKVDGTNYKFLAGDGPEGYSGDPGNNVQPHFSSTTPYNPDNYYLDRFVTSIRNVEEKDKVASLDLEYKPLDKLNIKFGGKFRNKRSTYDYRYITWIYDTKAPKAYLDNWEREPFPTTNWFPELGNNYNKLLFQYPTKASFENPVGNPAIAPHLTYRMQDATNSSYATGNYDTTEDVFAAYTSGEYKLTDDLEVVGGFRYEYTDVDANSFEFNDTSKEVTPISGKKNYGAFLPVLHFIYRPSNGLDLRAAVTRTFARPAFNELSPSTRINPTNLTVSEGNINLNPTFAWNFDVIGSYHLNKKDFITGGFFYKDISDLIYTASSQEQRLFDGQTDIYEISRPLNSESAKLYGFELGFRKKMDMLPDFLKGITLQGNYTLTKSETTLAERGGEKVGLMNQSPNIFNLSFIYERAGFAARLAGNYRDTFLKEIRENKEADRYQNENFQLDLNLSYTTKKKITFFLDISNLTNQELMYFHGRESRPEQVEFYGIRGKIGASFKF